MSPKVSYDYLADDSYDLNFEPLVDGLTLAPKKPDCIPELNINKVLIIKNRKAKGLSINALCERSDSLDD